MTLSFADLKKNRAASINSLNEELGKFQKKTYTDNSDKYWQLTVDKAGNGSATIRFLPSPEGESKPVIRFWEHSFEGPKKGDEKGQWYIEKSLTTLGQDDPVSEYNNKMWETGLKKNQDIVRDRKRKLYYVSNIYVVKDPANPDNDGKVFLYKYGQKIFTRINDLMNPAFDDIEKVNPFDLWEGANFKLRATKVAGYRNYDKSDWDKPSPLLDDDAELERIWKSEESLEKVIDPSEFKTYAQLKARLDKVLRINTSDDLEAQKTAKPKMDKLNSDDNPPWTDPDGSHQDEDGDDDNFFKRFEDGDE